MKETGIIRKIDELGRIVLPKEIRRTLGIKDGEDLEIFVEQKGIYLQKHSRLLPFHDLVRKLCEIAQEEMQLSFLITDRETILASTFPNLLNHSLNYKLTKLLEERESYESSNSEILFDDQDLTGYFYILPIIVSTDSIGLAILVSDQPFLSYMKNFLNFLVKIIVNKIDIL